MNEAFHHRFDRAALYPLGTLPSSLLGEKL